MEEPSSAPDAPPTRPGEMPAGFGAPTSGMAIAALICAIAGVVVPLVGLLAIALGVVAQRRIRGSGGRLRGRNLAVAGIGVGVGGVLISAFIALFFAITISTAVSTARTIGRGKSLQAAHAAAVNWSRKHGSYPSHIALLALPDDSVMPFTIQYNVHDDAPHATIGPGDVMVGDFDFSTYDPTTNSVAAARAAIDVATAPNGWYRFGDTRFAALPAPTQDGSVAFAWYEHEDSGLVVVTMDDGTLRSYVNMQLFWQENLPALRRVLPHFDPAE